MRWSTRSCLHSGYSSLRLESFLFTEEAFRDIKAKLKPDGVFAMYNVYRQGWVVGPPGEDGGESLRDQASRHLACPTWPRITPGRQPGQSTSRCLLVGIHELGQGRRQSALAFESGGAFWVQSKRPDTTNRSMAMPPSHPNWAPSRIRRPWFKIAPAEIDTQGIKWLPD